MTSPHDMKTSPPSIFEDHWCEEDQHKACQEQPRQSREARVENASSDISILDPVPLHPSGCQAVQHVPVSEIWDQSLHDQERKKALLEFSHLVFGGSLPAPSNGTQATRHASQIAPSATITRNTASAPRKSSNMDKFSNAGLTVSTTRNTHQSSWQQAASHATNHLGMHSLPAANMIPDRTCAMDPTFMEDEDESTGASQSSGNIGTKAEALIHQDRWDEKFEELKHFVGQNGHCHVPTHFSSNPSLARWCKRQRYQYKLKKSGGHSTLTDEREQKLYDVNFVWDVHSSSWEERFMELLDFKMKYGHSNVPRSRGKLGSWVKSQRRQYSLYIRNEKSHLTPSRVAKMNSVGFEWVGSKSPFPRDEHRA